MRVYVKVYKNVKRGVEMTPQSNKPKLIKRETIVEACIDATPEIESSISNLIDSIADEIKAKRTRKRKAKPVSEWHSLFQPKDKDE